MRRVLNVTCATLLCVPSAAAARQPLVRDSIVAAERMSVANGPVAELALLGGSILHVATAPARWSIEGWLAVPAVGAGVMGLSALDADGRELMRRNRSGLADRATALVEPFGADYSFALIAGLYLTGLARDDAKARSVAVQALASSIVAGGLVTPTLQYMTGRSRPWNGEDPHTWSPFSRNISFPSGHTTQAFAVASVIASRYESRWVKVTAYSLAGAVGLSRMYHDAHYVSDVAAAAFIGTAIGTSIARFGRSHGVSLTPTRAGTGVRVAVGF